MTYLVELTDEADRDLQRLTDFLAGYGEAVARRGHDVIVKGLRSLTEMPSRTPRVGKDLRVLNVPFGDSGYAISYRVSEDTVIVARIFHMRENR